MPQLNDLEKKLTSYEPEADLDLLRRAWDTAREYCLGKTIFGGRDLFEHSSRIGDILTDLKMDVVTVCAGLLHGVLSQMPDAEEMRRRFGDDIFRMVVLLDSLNVVSLTDPEQTQSYQLRQMFVAMAKDVRVMVVKLAGRLEVMQRLDTLPEEKRKEFARETLEIFSPLAHRLGMSQMKSEIEDLSFRYLYPEQFHKLNSLAAQRRKEREEAVRHLIEEMKDLFRDAGFAVNITGRTKHLFSIYQKMLRQGKEFNELYDLAAVRVIVDRVEDCYRVLGILHTRWTPVPGTFDNYIAVPKPNGYQSLHTVVAGPNGQPVEAQIRTWSMHMTSEYGIAAHWRYKEQAGGSIPDDTIAWIQRDITKEIDTSDPREYLESIELETFEDRVFVFTPMGKVITLPSNATPIDFAYQVHTDVGHRFRGARVNGRIAPLEHRLQNGDVVEIITGKTLQPSRDWLQVAVSGHARSKIRAWFKKMDRGENITQGRVMLEREMLRFGMRRKELIDRIDMDAVIADMNLVSEDDLYAGIGCGDISPETVVNRMRNAYRDLIREEEVTAKPEPPKRPRKKKMRDVTVEGFGDMLLTFGKCCSPVPGDSMVGFVSRGRGLSLHRKECPNIQSHAATGERIVPVAWEDTTHGLYNADVEIHCLDRVGLLADALAVLTAAKLNVSNATAKRLKDATSLIRLSIEVPNVDILNQIIARVARIEDVLSVRRKI